MRTGNYLLPEHLAPLDLDSAHRRYRERLFAPRCIHCGSDEGVQGESARALFSNEQINLCRPCAVKHHAYWDAELEQLYGSTGY